MSNYHGFITPITVNFGFYCLFLSLRKRQNFRRRVNQQEQLQEKLDVADGYV